MEKTVLKRGEVQSVKLSRGAILHCETGVLWLTFSGESEDVILRRGESWTAPGRGKAVVQALQTGTFRCIIEGKPRSASFLEWRHLPKPLTLRH